MDLIEELMTLAGVPLEEAGDNRALSASFKLPDAVPTSLFKLTNSMADVQKWKAKVLENNQQGVPKGEFDSVGYIMVSLVDNTIIPIARSDEHRKGFEVMDCVYSEKYGINPSNYYPIFAIGNNYPYDKEDEQAMYSYQFQ